MQRTADVPGSQLAGGLELPRPAPLGERLRTFVRHNLPILLLLSPLLLYIALVFAAPMVYQIAFAFFERILYKEILWLPVENSAYFPSYEGTPAQTRILVPRTASTQSES